LHDAPRSAILWPARECERFRRGSALKARLRGDHARGGWFQKFKPGRWYTAEEDGEHIRLLDGRRSAGFPRDEVEIRSVADDEWEVREAARVALEREGQSLDYPSRTAECPVGHRRPIPTRFDRPVVELRCRECDRVYRLNAV
jgi:hypothetical protein